MTFRAHDPHHREAFAAHEPANPVTAFSVDALRRRKVRRPRKPRSFDAQAAKAARLARPGKGTA
jgi:hypothetical protein